MTREVTAVFNRLPPFCRHSRESGNPGGRAYNRPWAPAFELVRKYCEQTNPSSPRKRRAVRGKSLCTPCGFSACVEPCTSRLGRACPVGLQPTDSIRGHPRLRRPKAKTWMRGTSPRKRTFDWLLANPEPAHVIATISPDSPARKLGPRACPWLESLGSRFRGNDEQSVLTPNAGNWITASLAGATRSFRQLRVPSRIGD
jgi:hypothetical protein